jgi:HEPN domain-containing protein
MAPRKVRTRTVDRATYHIYLERAQDFHTTMWVAFRQGNWNSAGLEAVHCAISATDALLIYTSGIRSSGEDHTDVVYLLRTHVNQRGVEENANHFQAILAAKHIVEYGARKFDQRQAETVVTHADRYFNWVKSVLGA